MLAAGNIALMDDRVIAAVQNNARSCDIVCQSHGLPTMRSEQLWTAPKGSPPLYPDGATLVPRLPADCVLSQIDIRPGCSVKDSFANLDLSEHGFTGSSARIGSTESLLQR